MAQRRRKVLLARPPEVPPVVKEGHVQEVRGEARGRYRQTKADPLRGYADAGQITEEHYMAGDWYGQMVKAMHPAGRDSTNVDRVTGGCSGFAVSDAMSDATKKVVSVDSHLSQSDRRILRAVLWEGYTATEAIRDATGEHGRHYPVPRLKEALQCLVLAISSAQRSGWKFRLTV